MNELFNGLEYVRTHIDDQKIINNGNFEDHLNKVKTVLDKLKAADFKINADKLFSARDNLEYLDIKITRQGIIPLTDEVQAIKDRVIPTNKRHVKTLI